MLVTAIRILERRPWHLYGCPNENGEGFEPDAAAFRSATEIHNQFQNQQLQKVWVTWEWLLQS